MYMKVRKMMLSAPRDFVLFRCFKELDNHFIIEGQQTLIHQDMPQQVECIRGKLVKQGHLIYPMKLEEEEVSVVRYY